MELQKMLLEIQKKLIVPKNQFNNFGKYNYRSCEDILEAVKPLLGDLILTITDEIVLIGDRYYVKATVKLTEGARSIEVSAYARETQIKKGMDEAQITGSASSYARKYALNGLFLIDDTKDFDTQDNIPKPKPKVNPKKQKIVDLVKAIEPKLGNTEMKTWIEDKTKEELVEKNYDQIIGKLELLKIGL